MDEDDLKLKELRNIEKDEYQQVEIAKSIISDDKKIEVLSLFEDDFRKCDIIETLQSDENKIKAMKQYLKRSFDRRKIIESLASDKNKIASLYLLDNAGDILIALQGIKIENDEQRLSIANSVKVKYLSLRFIEEIEDDETKIRAIEELISDESDRVGPICTLKEDFAKIVQLEKLSDESYKVKIICTLQDDTTKIAQLEKLSDEPSKVKVICALQDDTTKIAQLDKLSDELSKVKVICALQDDTNKIAQLDKLSGEPSKVRVICTLQDDADKNEQLKKIRDKFLKTIIVKSIKSNEKIIEDLLTNREKISEILLDNNRKYTQIGLDENITIGMEIESEGIMSETIGELEVIAQRREYNGKTRGWETQADGSLQEGVEVVSPILTDNKKDVEEIYMVCSIMQRCGQKTSENCGGHIHIGSDYLTSKEAYVNLFEIWGNAEKIICKMSNEKGKIPRMGLQEYASPISTKLNEAIESETLNLESEEDLEQFIGKVQDVQGDRYSGLNLLNINNGQNTIEFRIPNGTINPDTWIENARLFGRIVQISQKLAEIEKNPEQSKEDERLLDLRNHLKEEIPEQEKMEVLLSLLFSEEERQVYRERYISSSKLLEQIPDEKNPFQETIFRRVDFKKKKHSLAEFHDVAINDRIENTKGVIRETVQGYRTEGKLEQMHNNNLEGK